MDLNRVSLVDGPVKIKRVLISVADKTGLEALAEGLLAVNPQLEIYSTGGTWQALSRSLGDRAGKHLHQVSDYTGQPEMQGGLVKTLDFRIYLGLLSETYNPDHQSDLERTKAEVIDMVVVNLYPFAKTAASDGITVEDARTNIDIGGPCMLRASAKNFLRVASVCDPEDYPWLLETLERNDGVLDLPERFELAKKSFAHTALYDRNISEYLQNLDATALAVYQNQG